MRLISLRSFSSADDIAAIRGEEAKVARDNVVFELGLSFGRIGRDRTFIIAAPKEAMHTATDLAGVTAVIYEPESDSRKAMSNPASEILEAIEAQGRREHGDADGILRRGATTTIDMVSDAALESSRPGTLRRTERLC